MRSNFAGNIFFYPSKSTGNFHIKFFTLCKNIYGAVIKIHMYHWIFAQDYLNYLKDKAKHFDISNEESKSETNPVNQTAKKEDFVKNTMIKIKITIVIWFQKC